MERILVLQLKRIGDLILNLPALDALRAARPEAHITVIVADACGQLAPIVKAADEVLTYRRRKLNLAVWRKVTFSKYDIALDFTGSDRSILMGVLSRATEKITYAKLANKKRWRLRVFDKLSDASVRDLHTVEYHLALLRELGIDAPVSDPVIDIPEETEHRVIRHLEGLGLNEAFALIHPGTARAEKYWPADRWAEVTDRLRGHGLKVALTGSAGREEQAELFKVRAATNAELVDLSGKFDLVELAAIIKHARIALGVDSAAMHLANAFTIPQVVLFGPTNPYHWGPRHHDARVMLSPHSEPVTEFNPKEPEGEMSALSTASVIRAIDSLLT